jgi:hypothetical protein
MAVEFSTTATVRIEDVLFDVEVVVAVDLNALSKLEADITFGSDVHLRGDAALDADVASGI